MQARFARDFAALARGRRRQLGLTQSDVAEEIGMTRQWVAGFERGTGTKAASLDAVLELFAALDLVVDVKRLSGAQRD